MLAGYLVWEGKLRFPIVLGIGIVSAAAGDNFGYWLGRRFGSLAIERYGRRLYLTTERIELMQGFVARRGALAVFFARFLPGVRFLAGPLAGTLGLRFLPFLIANLLGAATYVPLAVGSGYAVGYGFGDYLERAQRVVGHVEYVVLITTLVFTILLMGWRMLRARRRL